MTQTELSELLLIDKPAGMTSHDVVDEVRRAYKIRQVGHAGTLDPFATGLLIVAVGKMTKELQKFVGLDKTYIATARLGATSDTYDLKGQIIIKNAQLAVSEEEIRKVLMSFEGGYLQKAPAFSAKKVKGQKLYEMARRGEDVEALRPSKQVDIRNIKISSYQWPEVTFEVTCSSGTYIRSLAHDLGEKLGCGAYLTALRRTRIGSYKIEDAKKLEELIP